MFHNSIPFTSAAMDSVGASAAVPHVVALPYPGRGHINPMLNLCELLILSAVPSSADLLVTFVVTEEWLGLLTADDENSRHHPGIKFRTIPNVIPSEKNRAADFVGFIKAVYSRMEAPVEDLLASLDPPPTAIVADAYVSWAISIGNRRCIPVYSLFPMSPSLYAFFLHLGRLSDNGRLPPGLYENSEEEEESLDHIPGVSPLCLSDFRSILASESLVVSFPFIDLIQKSQGLLFNAFYELEPHTIDSLKAQLPCPVYTVGPSIPYMRLGPAEEEESHCYLRWLDSQPESSVLYVSLGSFLSVSAEQMDEMALGLRASGVRFLWVARLVPSRIQEMGGEMGLVVPWCDQLRVLCHPSVGAFLTHCGWNSTVEAVYAGKPMVTFPIFWDQPPDSSLIVEKWRVGLRANKGRRGDGRVVGRERIADVVKRIMDPEGEEGRETRRRGKELMELCHGAIKEGGSSSRSLADFKDVLLLKVHRH